MPRMAGFQMHTGRQAQPALPGKYTGGLIGLQTPSGTVARKLPEIIVHGGEFRVNPTKKDRKVSGD